jgi:hypothetical protein
VNPSQVRKQSIETGSNRMHMLESVDENPKEIIIGSKRKIEAL